MHNNPHLFIIRPGAIGDTLLAFPVVRALREKYAHPHITLVGNAAVMPLALQLGLAEEVFDYGDPLWSELFLSTGIQSQALLERLRHLDLAICWLRDSDGIVRKNLELAGVGNVILAAGRPIENQGMHIIEYLAGTIGVSLPAIEQIPHFPLSNPSNPLKRYIAIHPGSGGAQKCWPAPKFAAVIQRLWQREQAVLLLAGPADHERLKEVLEHLPPPPDPLLLKIVKDAPLLDVAYQLQECRCYLGNDSGITHLAALFGLPTIVLFGPSEPATWRPFGLFVKIIQEPVLTQLQVDIVIQTLESRNISK